ncbi:MAG TPA: membrane dipeptidase, partial [Polyangia bacterium]|nr:membrane dipeptidase [Polyangia bacterium]
MSGSRTLPVMVLALVLCACGGDRERPDPGALDLVGTGAPAAGSTTAAARIDAAALHERAFVVDLIQDLVFRKARDGWTLTTPEAHVNIDKLLRGGVDLVFSAIAPEPGRPAADSLDEQLAAAETLVSETGGRAVMVSGLEQARAERAAGRIPIMVLLEGADGLADRLDRLHEYARRGLKIIGLTGPRGGPFGDSASAQIDPGGLTEAGAALVAACRDQGLVVDLTHASPALFWDVLAGQGSLVAVSHAACRALREHPRNLSDLQILALARTGGVMGLVFNHELITPGTEGATIADLVAHVERVRALHALDALAVGSDFGGIRPPAGLPDVASLPAFTRALLNAGLSASEVEGVLGGNALRLIDAVERRQEPSAVSGQVPDRPIYVDCDFYVGEISGVPAAACDHDLLGDGPRLPPATRIRLRVREMQRTPERIEVFGEPGTPWQVE